MPIDFQTELQQQRFDMVALQLRKRGIHDENVLRAMREVPRHEFVPWQLQRESYKDSPVPIGEGQTISQPFIVAMMLQALALNLHDRVLEIGTGTGYQAAVMSRIAQFVYTVERFPSLAERAREIFSRLGYSNIEVIVADGSSGHSVAAPYDAIIVAAAAPSISNALVDQLREGGRMILPVGPSDVQQLMLVRKVDGRAHTASLGACRFVPLVGSHGYGAES